jgi:hypothetical protein
MANKDKAKGAEYSRRAREKKKAEDARLGVEQVVIEMPVGIKKLLAAEVKSHGYDQVQALWQDMALSWAAADPEERVDCNDLTRQLLRYHRNWRESLRRPADAN